MDRAGPAAHNSGGPTTRGRAAPVATRMGHARRTEEHARLTPCIVFKARLHAQLCVLSRASSLSQLESRL